MLLFFVILCKLFNYKGKYYINIDLINLTGNFFYCISGWFVSVAEILSGEVPLKIPLKIFKKFPGKSP